MRHLRDYDSFDLGYDALNHVDPDDDTDSAITTELKDRDFAQYIGAPESQDELMEACNFISIAGNLT